VTSGQPLFLCNGGSTGEPVKEVAERLFKLAEKVNVRGSLSTKSNAQKAEKLCREIISQYHKSEIDLHYVESIRRR
jgi:hypothetical protein